jgi:hypothetical protein
LPRALSVFTEAIWWAWGSFLSVSKLVRMLIHLALQDMSGTTLNSLPTSVRSILARM